MIECGYYSNLKHETCHLLKGHEVRHFDYGKDQRPMLFSVKRYEDNQQKVQKLKPAKHVCGRGIRCRNRFCNKRG